MIHRGAALLFFFVFSFTALDDLKAQFIVEGTVYDSSRMNYVNGVRVISTGGVISLTDTMGRYSIMVREHDSLYFVYNNKPTMKFPVSQVKDPMAFDISIHARVNSKYKVLKEVIVYSNSYKQDSIENRNSYANIFGYKKPGLYTSTDPGGAAGFDLAEIINLFRFKRNKQLQRFRDRLQQEEEEKYVSMRFGKSNVSRITGLKGADLDSFLVWYRPDYEFITACNELQFTQFILDASYHFKRMEFLKPGKKEDE